jgi:hypothetical protein
MGLIFTFGTGFIGDSSTDIQSPPDIGVTNYSINDTGLSSANYDLSLWGAIKQIGKTMGFMFFGIGLPSDTPGWFAVIFISFQSGISLLALLVVLDAIHTG